MTLKSVILLLKFIFQKWKFSIRSIEVNNNNNWRWSTEWQLPGDERKLITSCDEFVWSIQRNGDFLQLLFSSTLPLIISYLRLDPSLLMIWPINLRILCLHTTASFILSRLLLLLNYIVYIDGITAKANWATTETNQPCIYIYIMYTVFFLWKYCCKCNSNKI